MPRLRETSSSPAVRCENITKAFGDGEAATTVLHGVGMEAQTGEVTFLVGPSGCGKTTLISIIAGMLTPEAGGVASVFGERISHLRGSKLTKFRGANIGFIFQQFNLLPALSIVENASVPLIAMGEGAAKAGKVASSLLERLGLGPQLGKLPGQLSGGQQQRVAIARALVHQPRLVVCDEPTASLDAASGQTVMGLMRDIALTPDRGVIVVTHDTRIYPFADRLLHMVDGRITRIEATQDRGAA
jgi:putative ABC transport system ATP-binding protein